MTLPPGPKLTLIWIGLLLAAWAVLAAAVGLVIGVVLAAEWAMRALLGALGGAS